MFFDEQMRPAIRPRKGGSSFLQCGVCDEENWIVARDESTGQNICEECIQPALTIDCQLVNLGKYLGLRHPRQHEFKGVNDH